MDFSAFLDFFTKSGFAAFFARGGWQQLAMIGIACVLLYLAIGKKFEPLLLLPIAFGMLLTNLPGANMFHEELFAGGHVHWSYFFGQDMLHGVDLIAALPEGIAPGSLTIGEDGVIGFGLVKIGQIVGVNYADYAGQSVMFNEAGKVILEGGKVLTDRVFIALDGNEVATNLLKTWGVITEEGSLVYNISAGLLDYLYLGVKLGIYPCLIFFGVGAMTDFGPLIANPKSMLMGAAAQLGIFMTFVAAMNIGSLNIPGLDFVAKEAASIGIIGGADGPTAIFVTSKLAPHLLGPIAVAAYSYMALVPVIQPPIMRLLTTKKERQIVMKPVRMASKKEKIIFPIVVTIFVALLVPDAAALVGCLMLGNLFRESGVTERLSKTVQNELCNIVTIFLGVTVGATATGATFLNLKTLAIIVMGVVAFGCGTAGGLLLAKLMNLFLPKGKKINPLIGSAGVSAVPMAARVSQVEGQKANPSNFLLMHAMGPNVAGVIGSAIAAGALISMLA